MKKKSKDQGYLIVANGGGTQCTGSGDGMDGLHRWFMLWGESRPWCASYASDREDKERVRSTRQACGQPCPQKKKEGRGSGTGLDIHSGFSKHSLLPKANFS